MAVWIGNRMEQMIEQTWMEDIDKHTSWLKRACNEQKVK